MRLGKAPRSTTNALPPNSGARTERIAIPGELLGTWSATRWQYVSRDEPSRSLDVVCDARGAVTLSLSAGTYVVTHDIAGDGTQTQGGMCEMIDGRLQLTADGADRADVVRYRVSGETLSLRCDESAWDFNGDGREEAAAFVAVLVRL